ncbi:MAG: 2-vinyl bacteriochlorophyllide hydratase [Pseudomonadota bacterium]|nr:2-vinyl bacteriochlorophyllide hydratase [Pseudomonadota bacterium]
MSEVAVFPAAGKQLYTREQREKRDNTSWTIVQGILAPVQFIVFLVSCALIARFVVTGAGYEIAALSIVVKTLVLCVIMITGAIWEKEVFGQYLFADSFFWEDVVSFFVIALHLAYVVVLLGSSLSHDIQILIAIAAYSAYVINAIQFLLKFRAARLASESPPPISDGATV